MSNKGNSHTPPSNNCAPNDCGGGEYDPCSTSAISADISANVDANVGLGVGNLVALDLCASLDADIGLDLF